MKFIKSGFSFEIYTHFINGFPINNVLFALTTLQTEHIVTVALLV